MSDFSRIKSLRRLSSILTVVGAVLMLFSGSHALAADADAVAKALTRLDDDWSKAAGTRDVERVASFYAEDAIAYPPNAPIAVGRPAAKKVWADYFAEPTFAISWKTLYAGASGDLGYTAGSYELSFKGPDGKLIRETGKYLCNWKKQKDGTWKAVHDMWNGDSK